MLGILAKVDSTCIAPTKRLLDDRDAAFNALSSAPCVDSQPLARGDGSDNVKQRKYIAECARLQNVDELSEQTMVQFEKQRLSDLKVQNELIADFFLLTPHRRTYHYRSLAPRSLYSKIM
jgi:hypothetical protein